MTNPAQQITLPNSPAFISYTTIFKENDWSDTGEETALVNGTEIIVLNGDFRADVQKLIRGVRFPYLMVHEWFKQKEKEWGASLSKNSSVQAWKLARGID